MKTALIPLGDLIDMLIDLEQSQGRDKEVDMAALPVVGAFPDVTMLRVKQPQLMTHTSRIPLFGIAKGDDYISLKLA